VARGQLPNPLAARVQAAVVDPTAIAKGKIGKSVEFGRKWIINCYRGGTCS